MGSDNIHIAFHSRIYQGVNKIRFPSKYICSHKLYARLDEWKYEILLGSFKM